MTIYDLKNMLIVCLVIDFLLYQARYQWNDIRGVKEDIDSGKSDRLPVWILGKYPAIIISSIILIIKLLAALFITLHLKNKIKIVLILFMIIIIICAIFYEIVRSKKCVYGTYFCVSLGYASRFAVGMWSAYPEMWDKGFWFCNLDRSHLIIVTLIISYAFLGEFSVTLSWLHEALLQKLNGKQIIKKHYEDLYNKLVRNHQDKNKIMNPSLKQRGKIYDLWNISYLISIIMLAIICLITNFNFIILIFESLLIGFSVIVCTVGTKNIKLYISIFGGIWLLGCLYLVYSFNLFPLYIYITQFMFICIYLFLRFLFNPGFDFIICCKNVVLQLLILFIGKKTYRYLKSESSKRKEE